MRKYLTVFAVDWQNQFVYRLNFALWRFRNILRLVMTYFLWTTVFSSRLTAFGYTQEQMIAYIFLSLFISGLVLSAPSNDHVGGEISSGDLSNFLVKPISYLRYWFTRDISSKCLNLLFAVVELALLWLILRPQLELTSSPLSLLSASVLLGLGTGIYFLVSKLAVFVSFWTPESTWGVMFFILVCLELLSGMIFPLDILPSWAQTALQFTPFPYLIYYPAAILTDRLTFAESFRYLAQALAWLGISYYFVSVAWRRGLRQYSAVGR